ncbi:hypothetical protein [Myxococcus xanthus]|uniref:Uncharacterized protein n=1 Tax=Myxococcus xanthus TaxID=34 RepID=A0A7Y4IL00_MYXXA|nr:hypothetical protein [Myxococcus xanthus]NOJ81187.1 hypothetical protein [Myxococcus xanthus]NOJ89397.1 hypothetical protein [Myxococcus xanthus]
MESSLDAVYYSQQVPKSPATLTLLGLIFDRVYFPGVHFPSSDLDQDAIHREIERIKRSGVQIDISTAQLIQCLDFAPHKKHVEDLCIFTASNEDTFGKVDKGAEAIAMELERLVFGPPPPNFFPRLETGYAKGIPGSKTDVIRFPGWLYYPANALIFASKNQIPLINDDPTLPVPGLGGVSPKNNAKLLSTILTIESMKLVLPEIPTLAPQELAEFRIESRPHTKSFRAAMLKLSKELNAAIHSDAKLADVQQAARFMAETTVAPAIEELRGFIKSPKRPWHKKAAKYAMMIPSLALSFSALPTNLQIATALTFALGELVDLRDAEIEKDQKMKRSEFYYLLQAQRITSPK